MLCSTRAVDLTVNPSSNNELYPSCLLLKARGRLSQNEKSTRFDILENSWLRTRVNWKTQLERLVKHLVISEAFSWLSFAMDDSNFYFFLILETKLPVSIRSLWTFLDNLGKEKSKRESLRIRGAVKEIFIFILFEFKLPVSIRSLWTLLDNLGKVKKQEESLWIRGAVK